MKQYNSLHTFLKNASEKEKEAVLNFVNRQTKSQVKKELRLAKAKLVKIEKELEQQNRYISELEAELQPKKDSQTS